jgi:hypothetical protein
MEAWYLFEGRVGAIVTINNNGYDAKQVITFYYAPYLNSLYLLANLFD